MQSRQGHSAHETHRLLPERPTSNTVEAERWLSFLSTPKGKRFGRKEAEVRPCAHTREGALCSCFRLTCSYQAACVVLCPLAAPERLCFLCCVHVLTL